MKPRNVLLRKPWNEATKRPVKEAMERNHETSCLGSHGTKPRNVLLRKPWNETTKRPIKEDMERNHEDAAKWNKINEFPVITQIISVAFFKIHLNWPSLSEAKPQKT